MKNLNNLENEIIIQNKIELVSKMQSVFNNMRTAIDSNAFEKELKFKDKTLVVDLGRQRDSSVGGVTTEVIIRIFNSGNQVSENQEDARISINGKKTQMFDYTNPYEEIKLKDFTPEQVEIMQFVKEDFEKQLKSLKFEEPNKISEEIQEDIAQEIQIPNNSELITDPSKLLPEGMKPANVSTQDFLRLVGQVSRIQGVIELAENNKKSLLAVTFAVLSFIFFAEDCYQMAIWLYHKLLALNFIS